MTNILCAVIAVLATNWTTVSRTIPIDNSPPGITYAVMRYGVLNQVGVRVTNYVANIVWKEKASAIVLESVPDASGQRLERSITDTSSGLSTDCYQQMPYAPELHWTPTVVTNSSARLMQLNIN